MFFKVKGDPNAVGLSGQIKKRLSGFLRGINTDDVAIVGQTVQIDTSGNVSSANTFTGIQTFTGNNTHSGTETFSNAAGVTTDTITPRTSGAGTALRIPTGVYTTTPVALSVTQSGGHYGLSKADGLAVTLPEITAATVGMRFTFTILTSCTSVGYVISTAAASSDVMIGGIWATIANPDAANDMEFNIAATTVNTLTLGATTAAGLAGGSVEFTAISATQWAVSGTVLGSGTIASNLFTTV